MNEQGVLMKCCWITSFFFFLPCWTAHNQWSPIDHGLLLPPCKNQTFSGFDDMVLLFSSRVSLSLHGPHTRKCAVGCRMCVIRVRSLIHDKVRKQSLKLFYLSPVRLWEELLLIWGAFSLHYPIDSGALSSQSDPQISDSDISCCVVAAHFFPKQFIYSF